MKLIKLLLFLGLMTLTCEVSAQSVYVTKTGEKYHNGNCHFLKSSKKEITLDVAKSRGFTACSVCKPTSVKKALRPIENFQHFTIEPISSTTQATASQCNGKTQAGTRCKRMTKSGNGRCYQHE